MTKKTVKAVRLDIGTDDLFDRIDVTSKGHQSLKLVCATSGMNVVFTFGTFLEIENRESLISEEGEYAFVFEGTSGSWNAPVFWVAYPELSTRMARANVAWYKETTKLWIFQSRTNTLRVYSNAIPQLTIQERTQACPDVLTEVAFTPTDATCVEVIVPRPTFFSDLDEAVFDRAVMEICSCDVEINEGDMILTLYRSNDPAYLKNVVGFFVRFKLDLCALRALITESNQSYLHDPLKSVG